MRNKTNQPVVNLHQEFLHLIVREIRFFLHPVMYDPVAVKAS